ncbi:hypothetical protein Dimus_000040 [Dionaea muscipula]
MASEDNAGRDITPITARSTSGSSSTPENGKSVLAPNGRSSKSEPDLAMPELGRVRMSPRLCASQVSRQENNGSLEKCKSSGVKQPSKKLKKSPPLKKRKKEEVVDGGCFFIGDSVPEDEARRRWPYRFQETHKPANGQNLKPDDDEEEDELILNVKCHYQQAKILNCALSLGDCALMKGKEGGQNYVGQIVEFFKTLNDEDYYRVQWFFRAEDTVMKEEATSHDKKRLFISDLMNDNPLDCIVTKVNVLHIPPSVKLKKSDPSWDFYYDMKYSVDYSSFCTAHRGQLYGKSAVPMELSNHKPLKSKMELLDVYSGCGGMSTGLCLGSKLTGVDLVTRWALEINKSACESLKLNHPEVQVRNESAEDFLDLLKEWDRLCRRYTVSGVEKMSSCSRAMRSADKDVSSIRKVEISPDEYEVANIVDIRYGDPNDTGRHGLHLKVRWVGYGPSDDTWEPIDGLSKCQEKIQDFVQKGFKAKILPRPGDVDVVCGGPPCQGISGYNRHRNVESPLDDEKNHQIVVFMDIVTFLKPKFVLMENVVDILRFAKGFLGRYALSRLVNLRYQARLGIMAAGCYGLPQFRLRVFLWGAHPDESLPQFPLPTHDVILRYGAPVEFERNVVAYNEGQVPRLEKALVLGDAISDLPPVSNDESGEEISYRKPPENEFQKFIRATRSDMLGITQSMSQSERLYDHRPLLLNEDDYLRVCRIPRKKGANFRDLPGVVVGCDNVVRRDPATEIILPSGKPLVPDYAINFNEGKSLRPFARLWWDETVPTVLTRPHPYSQVILHPEQDRVLTIREYARLQGFPDYYRFCGQIKERYSQIGNAVAVPVARALGYTLGLAVQKKLTGDGPLMTLPPQFPFATTVEFLQSPIAQQDRVATILY